MSAEKPQNLEKIAFSDQEIAERQKLLIMEYGREISEITAVSSFLIEKGLEPMERRDFIAKKYGPIFPLDLV